MRGYITRLWGDGSEEIGKVRGFSEPGTQFGIYKDIPRTHGLCHTACTRHIIPMYLRTVVTDHYQAIDILCTLFRELDLPLLMRNENITPVV